MSSPMIRRLAVVLCLCLATATASAQLPPPELVDRRAEELGTSGPSSRQARLVLARGVETGFTYPTLVVGIEKAPRDRIRNREIGHHSQIERQILAKLSSPTCGVPGVHDTPPEKQCKLARERLLQTQKYFDQGKRTFVSHVLAWEVDAKPEPSLLASAYVDCARPPSAAPLFECSETPYENGWTSLEKTGQKIKDLLNKGNFTHILLMAKGWNTSQAKSVDFFRSIPQRISKVAGDQPFLPIVVGLTWHSGWRWPLSGIPLLGTIPKVLSYNNKADDADEIGLTWANVLLHREILPAATAAEVPVVLIGHSFGARILSRAAASAELLDLEQQAGQPALISLLGAFSMNRFLVERCQGVEGAPYWDLSQRVFRLSLVWSREDKLVPLANLFTGANHVGGHLGYRRASAYPERFAFRVWEEDLEPSERADIARRRPCVRVDSRPPPVELIEAPMVDGHGHIDTPEMAALIWELIRDTDPTDRTIPQEPEVPAGAAALEAAPLN